MLLIQKNITRYSTHILFYFYLTKILEKEYLGDGETAQHILKNIYHTYLLLIGTMTVQIPGLSKTYLLKPILVPLIIWSK